MQENEGEKAENDKSSELFSLVERSESREEQQIEDFPRCTSSIDDLWASPQKKPKHGIVEPRVCPPEGKPTRRTNQLDYLLHHVIVEALKSPYAIEFKYPVNADRLKLKDYHDVIKRPMDLTTIENRLLNVYYTSANECLRDIETIFVNCFLYNPPDNYVSKQATELRSFIYKLIAEMPKEEITQTATKTSRGLKRSFEQTMIESMKPKPLPPKASMTLSSKASSNLRTSTKTTAKKSLNDDSIFKLPAYIRRSGNSKNPASSLRKHGRAFVRRKTIDVLPQGRNHGNVDKEVKEILKSASVQKLLPKEKKKSSGVNETVENGVRQHALFDSEQETKKKPSEEDRISEKMNSAETKILLKLDHGYQIQPINVNVEPMKKNDVERKEDYDEKRRSESFIMKKSVASSSGLNSKKVFWLDLENKEKCSKILHSTELKNKDKTASTSLLSSTGFSFSGQTKGAWIHEKSKFSDHSKPRSSVGLYSSEKPKVLNSLDKKQSGKLVPKVTKGQSAGISCSILDQLIPDPEVEKEVKEKKKAELEQFAKEREEKQGQWFDGDGKVGIGWRYRQNDGRPC